MPIITTAIDSAASPSRRLLAIATQMFCLQLRGEDSLSGKAIQGARPVRMAAKTSPLAAMQWASLPRPTTKAKHPDDHDRAEVIECDPETSHPTVAMIQPPITPRPEDGGGRMMYGGDIQSWLKRFRTTVSDLARYNQRCQRGKCQRTQDVGRQLDSP